MKEKKISIKNLIILFFVVPILIGLMVSIGGGVEPAPVVVTPAPTVASTEKVPSKQSVSKQVAPASETPTPKPAPAVVATPSTKPQTDRANVLVILKADASAKWKDNYEMVKYEYDNQVEAYDWVIAHYNEHPDIMAKAQQKWKNNYQMVKYEYENQLEAYNWITAQTEYPNIMTKAKQKWGTNYEMVKYEYENQAEAYKGL